MAQVTVQYFAMLREQAGRDSEIMAVEPTTSVESLYETLAKRYDFRLGINDIRFACNDRFVEKSVKLVSGDKVVFIPPVSGG